LLRTTFELLIKGAFWDCLSHKTFRDNSQVLDNDKQGKGKAIKEWLNSIFEADPNVEEEFEQISVSIYEERVAEVDEREGYGGEKRGFSPPEKRRLEVM
jgi:hypothetical protein